MGFIYNFSTFVTWPKETFNRSNKVLHFCFISDQPAANVLFKLNGQSIRNRKLVVHKIDSEIDDEKCNILFFGTDNDVFIRQTLALVRGRNLLTVGEVDGFTQMGGIINFFDQNNKLRFEINIDAAKREKLKFSAQLLQAAQRIVEETEEDREAQEAEIEKLKKKHEAEQSEEAQEATNTDFSDGSSPPDEPEPKSGQKRGGDE
jgi:hypothetical protein